MGMTVWVVALPYSILIKPNAAELTRRKLGRGQTRRASSHIPEVPIGIAEQLAKLAKLHADGALSEEEFKSLKAKVITEPWAISTGKSETSHEGGPSNGRLKTEGPSLKMTPKAATSMIVGFAVLLLGTVAWIAIAYLQTSPELRAEVITIQGLPALKITNTGSDDLKINDVQFNDRTDCQPELVAAFSIPVEFSPQLVRSGAAIAVIPKCFGTSIEKVLIQTDHGTGRYYWR